MEYGHVMFNIRQISTNMKAIICTADVSQLAVWPWLQPNIKYAAVPELQLTVNDIPPHYPFMCRQAHQAKNKRKAELSVQST